MKPLLVSEVEKDLSGAGKTLTWEGDDKIEPELNIKKQN
jgi:hypothetical protein